MGCERVRRGIQERVNRQSVRRGAGLARWELSAHTEVGALTCGGKGCASIAGRPGSEEERSGRTSAGVGVGEFRWEQVKQSVSCAFTVFWEGAVT